MSEDTPSQDVQRAVEYLQTSDDPLDSKISVIKNATETGEFTAEDVLSKYADSVSITGAIYPMYESQLRDLHTGVKSELGEDSLPSLTEVCHPNTLIETKDDVVTQAINIYTNDDHSSSEQQEQIKELIRDAQRDGIDVSPEEVIRALKEFQSTASASDDDVDGVSVGMETVSLATGISTPDEIQADEDYVYRVELADDVAIKQIDWYIGGTHAGEGETVMHTFEYAGVYTISVELTDSNGRTDHASKEVEVIDPSTIDIEIDGETTVDAGETVQYRAEVTTNNETVQTLEWELDNVPSGEGKVFSSTFDHDGEHTLSVTAHGRTGLTVTETESITVKTPTSINVTVDAPDTVYAGESANVHCEIDVENAYIEDTTCKIGDEVIPVDDATTIGFEHTFEEPGEYPVTVTATNNAGDTATGVSTIDCYVEPAVEIVESPGEVIRGDGDTFRAEFDERLSSSWGVNNASLTHVGDRTAQVTFNSGIAEEAEVTVEVENSVGDTADATETIIVHEPTVTAHIARPEEITAGSAVELSAKESEAEHAEIERIEWTLGDGMVIGRGETITYEFPSPGEYTVSATVHTDRNIGDTANESVEVEPETDVTAVIVDRGGPTTRDEFTLDARKSIAQNTTISSYTWDVESNGELNGDTVDVSFESPGSYDVELTVETEAGDVDTDTTTLTVEQYTDVTAVIDGPNEIVVGDRARFTARGSEPVNTSISKYSWSLNDKPAGSGEVFTQTFSKPGHYTVTVEVETATGDTDTASTGVVVETPESTVTAGLDVPTDEPITVGDSVTLSAAPSEIENGDLAECEWVVNGDALANTAKEVTTEFDDYGEFTVELTVIASDEVSDTVTEDVYVSPTVSNPPYDELGEDAAKADVFGVAVSIYRDDQLTVTDKNRFAAHLVQDAADLGVDVTAEDVEGHLADIDAVADIEIMIDTESIVEEREDRYEDGVGGDSAEEDDDSGEWEISSDDSSDAEETDDGIGLSDAVEFDVSDSEEEPDAEDDDEDTEEADLEENSDGDVTEEDDEDLWDISTGDGDTDTDESPGIDSDEDAEFDVGGDSEEQVDENEDEEEDEDDAKPSESDTDETEDVVDPDELPEVDEDDIDDRHTVDRISPETYDLGDSVFAMPNYTQDLMDFEYIMDENDELVPEGVNGAGVIAAENDLYVAIARVTGRDWSIHTMQKKRDIVKNYESQVLSGLDSPIQIVSIPTRFDLREHISLVNDVLADNTDNPEELLMNIGRSIYPNWLEHFMTQNDMKERQFYLVVPLSAQQLHEFKGGSENVTEKLAEAPVIGGFFGRFVDESEEDITKYQCLRELNTRMNRIKSSLRRMDVQLDRVDNRNEAMAVLYHYYHNVEPENEVFPTGPFTTSEKDATIGGISVDHLLEQHESAQDDDDGSEPGEYL